ncbi:MAG: STAS domain-containing protein [Chitinophagales bacterium]|nr:STAS domain-containing protein [Chitinophagales bacterium]MCB0512448.1 STAS domain-containing protein [Bacteroidota bacterium]MCB0513481.1 STAS domain-containing protein [Bacteroidota bacterium]MCB9075348.1 STAS domain-containing protein [Chitinophagales bacterium]HMZ68023.1 STAS domain-containing protein [Chitinophagales bacterium]
MKFNVDKQENVIVYEILEDKLTSANAPILKSELVLANTEGYNNIIIDLNNVRFVDSSGLSAILVGNRLCNEVDGIFALSGLNDTIKNLIKISQLDDILNIFSTKSDAIEAIQEAESSEEELKEEDSED